MTRLIIMLVLLSGVALIPTYFTKKVKVEGNEINDPKENKKSKKEINKVDKTGKKKIDWFVDPWIIYMYMLIMFNKIFQFKLFIKYLIF